MDRKELIIFGAGGGAIKVVKTLRSIGITIHALTDNDEKKWGKEIEGIVVVPPQSLVERNCAILIASDYQEEIESQLADMGILNRLVIKEQYIMEYMNVCLQEWRIGKTQPPKGIRVMDQSVETGENERQHNTRRVLIDLLECTEYGGIEIWSYMVGRGLTKKGYHVSYLGKPEEIKPPAQIEDQIVNLDISYENYWESVLDISRAIIRALPCTVIINRQGQSFIAATLVRKLYPKMLRIVSIIHTDRIILHRRQGYMKEEVDCIAGVSRLINEKLVSQFGVPDSKVYFKESPVEFPKFDKRTYTCRTEEPIRIGYAARITKTQKRVDLLPKLVNLMERENIPFVMQIAGEGAYLPKLKEALKEQIENGSVEILGQIDRDMMKHFWMKQDIFINMSEFEGTSLSMLEAMSYGVVPIVTNVSGVTDIITEQSNGFICEQHDIQAMQKRIEMLQKDRVRLQKMGQEARETVRLKCNEEEYINYIEKMIML